MREKFLPSWQHIYCCYSYKLQQFSLTKGFTSYNSNESMTHSSLKYMMQIDQESRKSSKTRASGNTQATKAMSGPMFKELTCIQVLKETFLSEPYLYACTVTTTVFIWFPCCET